MAVLDLEHIAVRGVSACVPHQVEENIDVYSRWGDYGQFVSTTGIERRRKADSKICSSDLCIAAAEKLIAELHWDKKEIDAIVFVTQTSDYILPATSNIIQQRLGLSENCYALDISLGCSGWVYGLSVLAALMQSGTIRKGLLLAGDTLLKFCSAEDKSTYPLFGDAGTVTALEYTVGSGAMKFCMHSDGLGSEAIIIRNGGYRQPVVPESFMMKSHGEGIVRNELNLELDGMSVFSFGISKAPKVVDSLIERFKLDKDSIDYYLFHQANLFMNEKIRKKLKLVPERVPYSLRDFGNTSCASIPLTMVTQISEELRNKQLTHIGCGFGVGLSWGSVYFCTDHIVCPELIEL